MVIFIDVPYYKKVHIHLTDIPSPNYFLLSHYRVTLKILRIAELLLN